MKQFMVSYTLGLQVIASSESCFVKIVKGCKQPVKPMFGALPNLTLAVMKKWLSRFFPALGLFLVFLSLMSALRPDPEADRRAHTLALRQIGHDYLSLMGDSTSRIPAVENLEDDTYRLRLSRDLDYDLLANVTASVLTKMTIREDYHLTLEDCTSGEVFLGSFWANPLGPGPFTSGADAACIGRDQQARCADFKLAFIAPPKTNNKSTKYWFLGVGSFFILGGLLLGRNRTNPVADPEPEASKGITLGANCLFEPTAQRLIIAGVSQELTYREAKLLQYFTDHPNEVLERNAIHDAVWGEEGVIVGRSLDVFVSRLRKKIAGVEAVEIKTVHGVGYQLLLS